MKRTSKFLALCLMLGLSAHQASAADDTGKKTGTSTPAQGNTGSEGAAQTQQSPIVVAEVWTVYIDQMEKEAITVTFPKGSAELSASDQKRLRDLIPAWKREKNIEKVIVAAWSDQPYPSQEGVKLTDAARDLADKRAEKVEAALEKMGIGDVDTFSMAEKPNWFQKAFSTDSAQIKGVAQNRQIDALNEERISKILDAKGGPSKAVIIVKREFNNRAS